MTRRIALLFAGACLALTLSVAAPPAAFARAGGGGGFSGGGGGGGGFSGGGGGFSSSGSYRSGRPMSKTESTIWLAVIIVFMLMRVFGNPSSNRMERTIVQGAAMAGERQIADGLAAIRKRDPGFDVAYLLDRVRKAFLKIQEAWSEQDMRPARAFISDGIFERFDIYILMQKAMGLRNKMSDVKVQRVRFVQIESDEHFDTVHIGITASAVDQDVRVSDGRIVRNRAGHNESFVEVWSFIRAPGVQTVKKSGLMEGFCPNCGAPIEITDSAKCESCSSWINSGEYDWVLAEITQVSEWTIRDAASQISGLAEMRQRDPGLNVQFLEDRASVMFWRWQAAHWERDGRSLNGVAGSDFVSSFNKSQSAEKILYRNAAVGGVNVLAMEAGRPLDKAHVLVRWSGERFKLVGGEMKSQGQVLYNYVFILARKADARTDVNYGLRSLVCPSCGAPPSDRSQAACEFCQTPFNDGSRHWILADVVPQGRWRRPTPMLAKKKTAPVPRLDWSGALAPTDALAVLVGAMILDGKVDPREQAFARSFAQKHSIPQAQLERLIAAARSGRLEVPTPDGPEQSRAFLQGVVQMSLADGHVSADEMRTLIAFSKQLGLPDGQIQKTVAAERAAMFERAKRQLA